MIQLEQDLQWIKQEKDEAIAGGSERILSEKQLFRGEG